jgi:hypothetical protein
LVNELNFLNVHAHMRLVIAGHVLMLALLATACVLLGPDHFQHIVQLGIGIYFLLALGVAAYCAKLGFRGGPPAHRIAWLSLPVSSVLAHAFAGNVGVLAVCAAFAVAGIRMHGWRITAAIARSGGG